MAKIDFKENGSKGVESSKKGAHEPNERGQEQTQSDPISVPLSNGTLSFESVAHARQSISWFAFHNRAIAQVLGEQLQCLKGADDELICALGFLNRDMAELICAIDVEIEGAA